MSYFGIGIYAPKRAQNVGSLYRSALLFGAQFIFTIGRKLPHQMSDTFCTHNHIPYYFYPRFEDFYEHLPYACRLVGVEMNKRATMINSYVHLPKCVYLLGAEDNGLPNKILEQCHNIIQLPNGSFNVANAGTIVMYDRWLKENQQIK